MKKVFLLLIAAGGALSAMAQAPAPDAGGYSNNGHRRFTKDSALMRWVFDVNLLGGALTQNMTMKNTLGNYNNNIASLSNTGGNLKFTNGASYGFDAQLGYFFGHSCHFGIGAGFMYLQQQGDATMSNNFHVEYQATDNQGNTYRQLITSDGPVKEHLQISNMNIPVLLKYKTRFSKLLGFTADAGALINLQTRNSYSSNAAFDYEAIYQHTGDTKNGLPTTYDNGATPNINDVFYTKNSFVPSAVYPTVNDYFNKLQGAGYNVGLGVKPNNNSGSVSYMTGSVGFIVQPSLCFFLSDNVALNVGAYYLYQPFTNSSNNTNGYMLTNKAGDYHSVLNSVSSGNSQSYGANIGVRFFFGKQKDSDHDGVPDKSDWCPYVYGLPQFHGCPDRDGDGIPDNEDSCVNTPGIARFHGCPDSDGDGIPDKEDACPYQAGPAQFHGCPDRDGDGIPDKDDLCPDKPGLAQFQGCPDTDGDGVPDNLDQCPTVPGPADNHGCPYPPKAEPEEGVKVATPIMFELNKTVIHRSSYPVLDEAVKKLNEDKSSYIIVDGYTDITGKPAYNKTLSLKRAYAVKARLIKMGIRGRRIKIVGHGAKSPAADNDTEEGRMKNRRAVMHLNVGE